MIKKLDINDVMSLTSNSDRGAEGDGLVFLSDITHLNFENVAFQTKFMTFVFCRVGTASLAVDKVSFTLCAGDLLIVLNDRTISHINPSDDFRGLIMMMSQELSGESFVGMQNLWPYLLYIFANPVVHLSADERELIEGMIEPLKLRREKKDYLFRQEMMLTMMRIFYYDVCYFLQRRQMKSSQNSMRNYSIFDQFVRLVQERCRTERSVAFYAKELGLTPKYLSEVVKEVSGKTAGKWITKFVLLEIKNLLHTTPMTIKEITEVMHFPNQSFLGKYFKKQTGMSLSGYRKGV